MNLLKKLQGDNKKVILLGNINQNMYRVQSGKVSFATLCNKRRMYTAPHEREENLVPSHKQGRAVIDHIVLGNIETTNVKEAGQLPFGVGFATSDHQALYADIDICDELQTTIEELALKNVRRLVCKNKRNVERYIKEVLEIFQKYGLYDRVAKLYSETKGGKIDDSGRTEYETLDRIVTEVMLRQRVCSQRKIEVDGAQR